MRKIDTTMLDGIEEEQYKALSWWHKRLLHLMAQDTNYSLFIAGILSGVPATLLLNLVTLQLSEIASPLWYGVAYGVTVLASVFLCIAMFRFAVAHVQVQDETAKRMETESADIVTYSNAFVRAFQNLEDRIQAISWVFIVSLIFTVAGVVALFYFLNINL